MRIQKIDPVGGGGALAGGELRVLLDSDQSDDHFRFLVAVGATPRRSVLFRPEGELLVPIRGLLPVDHGLLLLVPSDPGSQLREGQQVWILPETNTASVGAPPPSTDERIAAALERIAISLENMYSHGIDVDVSQRQP